MTGYLQELRARAIKFEMSEIPAKMDSIAVSYTHLTLPTSDLV